MSRFIHVLLARRPATNAYRQFSVFHTHTLADGRQRVHVLAKYNFTKSEKNLHTCATATIHVRMSIRRAFNSHSSACLLSVCAKVCLIAQRLTYNRFGRANVLDFGGSRFYFAPRAALFRASFFDLFYNVQSLSVSVFSYREAVAFRWLFSLCFVACFYFAPRDLCLYSFSFSPVVCPYFVLRGFQFYDL